MGRRYKGPTDPPEDKGEPGHFYWEEPKVVEVKGKPYTPTSNYGGGSSMFPRSPSFLEGDVRLESSHKILGYTPPKGQTYELTNWPMRDSVADYVQKWRVQGFGEGAIVTRRHQPVEMFRLPIRWGVVILVHKYTPTSRYAPYLVKWFTGDTSSEGAWAEDLVLIHSALDREMLLDILEAQEIPVEELSGMMPV